jgi:hypothetical protein
MVLFMLKVETSEVAASFVGSSASIVGTMAPPQIVEVGLLLPANWAAALIELSKERGESVAQILRASVAQTLREFGLAV